MKDITSIKGKRVEFYTVDFNDHPFKHHTGQKGVAMADIRTGDNGFFVCVKDESGVLHTLPANQIQVMQPEKIESVERVLRLVNKDDIPTIGQYASSSLDGSLFPVHTEYKKACYVWEDVINESK